MPQVNDRDVEAIKDWLAKEPHLPKTFDDNALKKFLFSCDCSLERTKKCIEEFCTRRTNMPEIYTNRDPCAKRLQLQFQATTVTTYTFGVNEILIHQLNDTTNFDFYDIIKCFTIMADNWINLPLDVYPENHYIIIDIKNYTLKLVAKSNVFFGQKFFLFLIQSMPVRLKEIHIVNCPPYYDYFYQLLKPVLPDYVCEMAHFHPDHTGLHKYIDKKHLPKEYDGERQSMAEQSAFWVKDVSEPEKRKSFLNDNYWKAELSQKMKNDAVANSMSGSFKALAID